jgi:hypothetical protein
MSRRAFLAATLAAASVSLVTGCAIQQQAQVNKTHEANITAKEAELQEAQSRRQTLEAERRRLQDDLKARELTAAEFHTRLDRLKELNERTAAASEEERRKKAERARQIEQSSNEAKAIESDRSLPDAEKRRRLEALREKTRKLLEFLREG